MEVFISTTISPASNQLLGFLRSEEVEVVDVDTGISYTKEGIAFGLLLFRIDILY